jgi:hypothetical protein
MPGRADDEVGLAADHVAVGHQELHQDRDGIALGLRVGQLDELAGDPVEGFGGNLRPAVNDRILLFLGRFDVAGLEDFGCVDVRSPEVRAELTQPLTDRLIGLQTGRAKHADRRHVAVDRRGVHIGPVVLLCGDQDDVPAFQAPAEIAQEERA